MFVYGRASIIPGPKYTLVGRGLGLDLFGSRAMWARCGLGGVATTGMGGVEA